MFRLLKLVLLVIVVGASLRWYSQHQIESKILHMVQERQAKLPTTIGPSVVLTGVEFSNRTLRNTMEFTEKQDFGLRRAEAEKMLLDQYCRGTSKQFADMGFTAEFVINYHTELGLPKTATITVPPQKCG